MAAKVRWDRGAWWIFTHHRGKRTKKRVGPTQADKRAAEKLAREVNAALVLGTYRHAAVRDAPVRCQVELRRWHSSYGPTMKPSYRALTGGLIDNHLAPYFGDGDLRELRESDLLAYVKAKLGEGLAPKTIRNAMSVLRRVMTLLEREGRLDRNPAARIGELMRRVDQAALPETSEVDSWTRSEVQKLLATASEHEPRFAPLLRLLLSTGMRRGEALGLQWADVDFDRRILTVRRSITSSGLTTPKSGRARRVVIAESLALELFDLVAVRQRESMAKGWPELPEWVFCSEAGTAPEPGNVDRVWRRVRRRAAKEGVRPLKLHCARHTWATMALHAGKSVRWVADQLGHSDPALTLRVYAHAMPEDETDLSFADFDTPKRPYTAPVDEESPKESRNYLERMARREGLEPPTLRFEA